MKEKEKTYQERQDLGKDAFSNIFAMKDRQIVKWQRIAYACIATTFASVLCVTYIGTKSTFIPYIVHVDEKTGYVQAIGALTQRNEKPTDAEVTYFLSRFVEGMRSIPLDKNVLQTNVNRAVRFMSPEAAKKYKNLYMDSFTKKIGKEVSKVTVLSCLPVSNAKDTYTVRWKESVTGASTGGTPEDRYYSGNFTVETKKISKKEELVYNPIGLYITDFSYSEEQGQRKGGSNE